LRSHASFHEKLLQSLGKSATNLIHWQIGNKKGTSPGALFVSMNAAFRGKF
jgi:hypothetical protein